MGCNYSKVKPVLSRHLCCPLCTCKSISDELHPYAKFWVRKEAFDFRDRGGVCPKQRKK
jgi:hypothetical protein